MLKADQLTASPGYQPACAVTLRAFVIGLLLGVGTDLWCIHAEAVARTTSVNLQQFPVSLAAPFALLDFVFNPGLAALRRLRVGGAALYLRSIPFFIGVIVGHAVPACSSTASIRSSFPARGTFCTGCKYYNVTLD